MAKKITKKAVSKKTAAKPAKKTVAPAKKTSPAKKKAATKKVVTKKSATKAAPKKKVATKTPIAKKASKKPAAKKAVAKKVVKKTVKKSPVTKAPAKKTVAKSPIKKAAAKKIVEKSTVTKASTEKSAGKRPVRKEDFHKATSKSPLPKPGLHPVIKAKTPIENTTPKNVFKSNGSFPHVVVDAMLEKKAVDVAIIDLKKIKGAIADYFILCSGGSDTQVDAIADSVEDIVYKKTGTRVWHKEGIQNKEWILLDYVDVVVHIFKKDRRTFYALEELWGDANITRIENV